MNINIADAAPVVAIVVAVILVFWRGAGFMKQITDAIQTSENRLRTENTAAHASITSNIDDVKRDVREVKQDVRTLTQQFTQHLLNRPAQQPDA